MAKKQYEHQPGEQDSITGFNAPCREIKGKPGGIECLPRNTFNENGTLVKDEPLTFEDSPMEKPIWESHPVEIFVGGCALGILILACWLSTRRSALRNNILIGGATIGAFCLNPVAGAIVLAAWIFSSRINGIKSRSTDP